MKTLVCALLLLVGLGACAPREVNLTPQGKKDDELARESFSDPRYAIFLAQAYKVVGSRRGTAKRKTLLANARKVKRGRAVAPQKVRYRRSWSKVDREKAEDERQRLLVLLGALSTDSEDLFASAALAQANFDCWILEMRRSRRKAATSPCTLDLAAALGEGESRAGLTLQGPYPALTKRRAQRGQGEAGEADLQSLASQQERLLGGQFESMRKYIGEKNLGELDESIKRQQRRQQFQKMQAELERRIESQIAERVDERVSEEMEQRFDKQILPRIAVPRTWTLTFKFNKHKLDRQGARTLKNMVRWYREASRGAGFAIESMGGEGETRNESDERVAGLISSMLKEGIPRSAIIIRVLAKQKADSASPEAQQEQQEEEEQKVGEKKKKKEKQKEKRKKKKEEKKKKKETQQLEDAPPSLIVRTR